MPLFIICLGRDVFNQYSTLMIRLCVDTLITFLCSASLIMLFPLTTYAQVEVFIPSTENPVDIEWNPNETNPTSPLSSDPLVANISKPSITVFKPEPGKSNGASLIIAPGGGFHFLSWQNEGTDVAQWCIEKGITAFVLKYRLVPTGDDPFAEFIQKVTTDRDAMDEEIRPFIQMAKEDGLAAVKYVRDHADELGINPDKIGIIGFSAGGTVAGSAAF